MHSDGENYNKRNVKRKYKKENYKWTSREIRNKGKNQQNSLHFAKT